VERRDRERDRTRDRSEVGDRSAMKQELGSTKEELGLNKVELDSESRDVHRERLRSEVDGFNKGPDEHVPGRRPRRHLRRRPPTGLPPTQIHI
jgi:hypothetical protein